MPQFGRTPGARLAGELSSAKFTKGMPALLERAAGLGLEAALQAESGGAEGRSDRRPRGGTASRTGGRRWQLLGSLAGAVRGDAILRTNEADPRERSHTTDDVKEAI